MLYKNVEIDLPKTGNILLWVSGGLDSALGLYIISKHIKENKLKPKIVVATWQRDKNDNPGKKKQAAKDWNVTHAKKVIAWVEKELKLTKTCITHVVVPTPPKTGLKIEEQHWVAVFDDNKKKHKLKSMFGFVTRNPPRSVMKEHGMYTDERPKYRDGAHRKQSHSPWQNMDKQFIARCFESEGLMKGLYPLTRSCEGQANKTKNFTKPCEKCWWCLEKYWAFKQY